MLIFLFAYGVFVWFALIIQSAINLNIFINETREISVCLLWVFARSHRPIKDRGYQ